MKKEKKRPSLLTRLWQGVQLRSQLLGASLRYSWQIDVAYWTNNWGNLISTTMFTASFLLFVHIIFGNVDSVAGYTYEEMIFLFLIGQVAVYLRFIFLNNLKDIARLVNSGDLDLILTKPLPSLFYLITRRIPTLSLIRDGLPILALILFIVDWDQLSFSPVNILVGSLIFIMGLLIWQAFYFFFILPTFIYGKGEEFFRIASALSGADSKLPWESYPAVLKITFTSIIPILFVPIMTTSVLLGKSNPEMMLGWTTTVTILILPLQQRAWNWALRHYSSASS